MKIHLLEPFFTGSHRQWAEGLQKNSRHQIEILSMKGRHWKWRMYGGAVTLAESFLGLAECPDLLLASDMLDLPTFLALTRVKSKGVPVAVYFHENQVTYPWSPSDKDVPMGRNNQYGFINYTSALSADRIFFNSRFHKNIFLDSLPSFLSQFPDHKEIKNVAKIAAKSEVLPLGLDLKRFSNYKLEVSNDLPVILWNHRWEYDKCPQLFFETLFRLKKEGHDFRLVVLGEAFKKSPAIFEKAKNILAEEILHFGFATDFKTYAQWLWKADILPVTSQQDFFGGSVVEAIFCNCFPLLPKRLAYPEHLPEAIHKNHIYETENDFYEILKKGILNFKKNKFNGEEYVGKYDWVNLIERYDSAFEIVVDEVRKKL